jgi:hypothetical protein
LYKEKDGNGSLSDVSEVGLWFLCEKIILRMWWLIWGNGLELTDAISCGFGDKFDFLDLFNLYFQNCEFLLDHMSTGGQQLAVKLYRNSEEALCHL